ncbi:MAG: LysR family transcriptional regulator [Paraglaciecola sp.]|nr:LysR family transcriptional regulator [Paraglaciecola sp.]NCT48407.1 LysR family transcriptional regulator [Paraglaciecola sp.]
MNTKQLQYFLTTAEFGSITAAARELDVAQPAVSLQLANLEHELKIKLFERDFRGVELTDAGNRFAQHAKLILRQIQAAKVDLLGSKKECRGKVVIGLSQSACNVLSVELLTELEHRFANIECTFRVGPSHTIEQWLADEKVDIALCYQAESSSVLANSLHLIRENLYLYISREPKNPSYSELAMYGAIEFNELQYYDIFMPDEQDALSRLLVKQAQVNGIALKPKNAFGQLMTTLHYVAQGFGLAVLPSSAAFHLENNKSVRPISVSKPELQCDVYLQIAERKLQDAASVAVYELIREVTAHMHRNHAWRGTLVDKKYLRPPMVHVEAMVSG